MMLTLPMFREPARTVRRVEVRHTRAFMLARRCCAVCIAAVLLLTVPGVGQQDTTVLQIKLLIEDDLACHAPAIQHLASRLGPAERMALYKEHKEYAAGPFVANLFLGMGIGSWAQGDALGGTVGLIGAGVAMGCVLSFDADALRVGLVVHACTWTFALLRTWLYAAERNAELRKALRFDDSATLHVGPTMYQTVGGTFAPGLSLAMSF